MTKKISELTEDTNPALAVELEINAAGTSKKLIFANLMKIINLLTEDVSPADGDFVITYDVSTNIVKKVLKSNIGGGGLWTQIGNVVVNPAVSTVTLTYPSPVNFDVDAAGLIMIVGMLSLQSTTEIRMEFDGATATNYDVDGRRITGGVETLIDLNDGTFAVIASTNIGVGNVFFVMFLSNTLDDRPNFICTAHGRNIRGQEQTTGAYEGALGDMDSIRFFTSTGNFLINTRFTAWLLARA